MEAGASGVVTLSITFEEIGEVCHSATIFYDGTDYGEYEAFIVVEPETGDADLWVDFGMESDQFSVGPSRRARGARGLCVRR